MPLDFSMQRGTFLNFLFFFAAKGKSLISGVTKRETQADSSARASGRTGSEGWEGGGGAVLSGSPRPLTPRIRLSPPPPLPPHSAGTPIGTHGVRSSGLGGIAMAHSSPFP